MRAFALVFLVSTAVAVDVARVTACQSLVGCLNNELLNQNCRELCNYDGTSLCPNVSTAQELAECVVKLHPHCQLLNIDALTECRQAVGNAQNLDWDDDCDVQCLHYFESGDSTCGDVSQDGSLLIQCVLDNHGDRCDDLRQSAPSAPSAPVEAPDSCQELVISERTYLVDKCRQHCSDWADKLVSSSFGDPAQKCGMFIRGGQELVISEKSYVMRGCNHYCLEWAGRLVESRFADPVQKCEVLIRGRESASGGSCQSACAHCTGMQRPDGLTLAGPFEYLLFAIRDMCSGIAG